MADIYRPLEQVVKFFMLNRSKIIQSCELFLWITQFLNTPAVHTQRRKGLLQILFKSY